MAGEGADSIDLYADVDDFNQPDNEFPDGDLYDDVITASSSGDGPNDDNNSNKQAVPTTPANYHGRKVSLYIGNLTWWTTDQDITDIVSSLGVSDLLEIKFWENRANGQSKGYCSVFLGSDSSARVLLERLPKKELHGQGLVVTRCSRQALNQFENQARKGEPPQQNGRNSPPVGRGPGGPGPGDRAPGGNPGMNYGGRSFMPNNQRPPGPPVSMQGPPMGGPPGPQMHMPPVGPPFMGQVIQNRQGPPPGPQGPPMMPPQGPPLRQGPPVVVPMPFQPPPRGPPAPIGMPPPRGPDPGHMSHMRPDWDRHPGPFHPPVSGPNMPGPPQMNRPPPSGPPGPLPQPGGLPMGPGGPGAPPHSIQQPHPSQPAPHVNPAFFPPQVSMAGGPSPQFMPTVITSHHQPLPDPYGRPPAPYNDPYSRPSDRGHPPPSYQPPPQSDSRSNSRLSPVPSRGHHAAYQAPPQPDSRSNSRSSPVLSRHEPPQLSESEFEEILQRNKTVMSSAISRAVQDAGSGEFASAIETLVTAISLIKQSKISSDDRCKILITSLQDTLHGVEAKSYGPAINSSSNSGRDAPRDRRSSSHDRDRDRDRERSSSKRSRHRSRSRDREYRERSRDRDRDRHYELPPPSSSSERHRDRDRDRDRDREYRSRH